MALLRINDALVRKAALPGAAISLSGPGSLAQRILDLQ